MSKTENYLRAEQQNLQHLNAPDNFEAVVRAAAQNFETTPATVKLPNPATRFLSRNRRQFSIVALAAVLIIVLTSVLPANLLPNDNFSGIVNVSALAATENGLDLDGGFLLTASEPLSKNTVEKSLQITPAIEYKLKESKGGTQYEVIPEQPLNEATVYKVVFDPERTLAEQPVRQENSWAFQTMENFKVKDILPAPKTIEVPVDIGIQIAFSQQVSAAEAAENIIITPALQGSWAQQEKLLSYTPAVPMQENTVYQLKINENLTSTTGEKLSAAVTCAFVTASSKSPRSYTEYFYLGDDNAAYRPDEIAHIDYNSYSDTNKNSDLKIKIYQYADNAAYCNALNQRQSEYSWAYRSDPPQVDTAGLREILNTSTTPYEFNNRRYLRLPQALPQGLYLAEVSSADYTRQQLFQVTNLTGYASYGAEDSLVWLHDLTTGLAAADAVITNQSGKNIGKTAADGTAKLTFEKGSKNNLVTAQAGNEQLIMQLTYNDALDAEGSRQEQIRTDYWSYLYTDRALYKAGDTLNFFGVLSPRSDKLPSERQFTVQLRGFQSWEKPLVSTPIEVKDGSFDGTMTLPNLPADFYYVQLYCDDVALANCYIDVKDYVKPSYELQLSSDKAAIMLGDSVKITATTAFFDGTPLPNQGITSQNSQRGTTDKNGKYTFKNTPQPTQYSDRSLYDNAYYYADATFPELGAISKNLSVAVFNSDLDLALTAKREQNQYQLTVQPYQVKISGIHDWQADLESQYRAPYQGQAALTVEVLRRQWDKVQVDTALDPYTNQNIPIYEMQYSETSEGSHALTLNGSQPQTLSGALASENSYLLKISGTDSAGRPFTREKYLNGSGSDAFDSGHYIFLNSDKPSYGLGEQVKLSLRDQADSIPQINGEVLYFRSMKNIIDYQVSNLPTYEFTFDRSLLPNVNVSSVYFDGKNYHYNYTSNIYLSSKEQSCQLQITADKESYHPGEEVKLDLLLTDKKGQPLAGNVNLNLVDEALLTLADQEVNIGSLFSNNLYSNLYRNLLSHPEMNSDGAEGGGEGDGEQRDNFRDTAFFQTVRTDNNGHATVTFTVPDNVTSWRIIWQAFAEKDLLAGCGKDNLQVTLPFFVDYRLATTLLNNDAPTLGLRSAGTALTAQAEVTYTVAIPALSFQQTVSQQGKRGSWLNLQLPKIPTGTYQMTITATSGSHSDSISTEFKAVDTLTSSLRQQTLPLVNGLKVEPLDSASLISVTLSNQTTAQAVQGLSHLAGQQLIRAEQRIAAQAAQALLAEKFRIAYDDLTPEQRQANAKALLTYQNHDGGIQILPYGDSQLYTSALTASVAAQYFDKNTFIAYFNTLLAKNTTLTTVEKAYALWGLAALGEPVLPQIDQMLAATELDGQTKLALTLGLSFAGEGARAKQLADAMIQEFTTDLGSTRRANIGDNALQTTQATAQLAMLASIYQLPETTKLYQYVLDNPQQEDYFLLEQLLVLRNLCQTITPNASFTYCLGDKKETIDLSKQTSYSLLLTPEQLRELTFSEVKGAITLTTSYEAAGLPQPNKLVGGDLQLQRSYKVNGKSVTTVPSTGLVKVDIDYRIAQNAPAGYYKLVDALPAGLRFVSIDYDDIHNRQVWHVEDNGSRQVFGIYKGEQAVQGTLTYLVRVAMPGTFTAEAPYLMHSNNPAANVIDSNATIVLE